MTLVSFVPSRFMTLDIQVLYLHVNVPVLYTSCTFTVYDIRYPGLVPSRLVPSRFMMLDIQVVVPSRLVPSRFMTLPSYPGVVPSRFMTLDIQVLYLHGL